MTRPKYVEMAPYTRAGKTGERNPRVSREQLVRIAVAVFNTTAEKVGRIELAKARIAHEMYRNGATVKAIRERLNVDLNIPT